MVPVTTSGVGLRVGEGVVVPVPTTVTVIEGVGVARVFGARERAIKPIQ